MYSPIKKAFIRNDFINSIAVIAYRGDNIWTFLEMNLEMMFEIYWIVLKQSTLWTDSVVLIFGLHAFLGDGIFCLKNVHDKQNFEHLESSDKKNSFDWYRKVNCSFPVASGRFIPNACQRIV